MSSGALLDYALRIDKARDGIRELVRTLETILGTSRGTSKAGVIEESLKRGRQTRQGLG